MLLLGACCQSDDSLCGNGCSWGSSDSEACKDDPENYTNYVNYTPMDWKYSSSDFNTVVIGSQTWMAENVRYEAENVACYDNDIENCETFGVLYDWETAKNICPAGWHLPNDDEWITLGKVSSCSELKDANGFATLAGGLYDDYRFRGKGDEAGFWSATEGAYFGSAHYYYCKPGNTSLKLAGFYTNKTLAYVRCIKDKEFLCGGKVYNPSIEYCFDDVIKSYKEEKYFSDNRDNNTYKYMFANTKIWMAENLRHEVQNTKCYGDDVDNCETFGVLYDWETAKNICPAGWHLPNDEEWTALGKFGSCFELNDANGFATLPGGIYADGFKHKGVEAGFWSATAGLYANSAHYYYCKAGGKEFLNREGYYTNNTWAYVRCVKD